MLNPEKSGHTPVKKQRDLDDPLRLEVPTMTWNHFRFSPHDRILLAGIISLPAFLILIATGHILDSITVFHGVMSILMQMLVFPRTVTVRVSQGRMMALAWLPAIVVLLDTPVAVYVAATDTIIRLQVFNIATGLVTIFGSITLLYLGVRMSRANPNRTRPMGSRRGR